MLPGSQDWEFNSVFTSFLLKTTLFGIYLCIYVCLSLITSHPSSALDRKLKLVKRRETDKAP